METWTTIIVAFIVALSTLGATWLSNRASLNKYEKELDKEIETESRQRRWEVRSKPLLILREELATMFTLQNKVTNSAAKKRTNRDSNIVTEELEDALNNWNAYLSKGNLNQSIYMQYDSMLINKVLEIQQGYINAFKQNIGSVTNETEEAIKSSETLWPKVVELQELINKKLEEL